MLIGMCVIFCTFDYAIGDVFSALEKFEGCLKTEAKNTDDFISTASDISHAVAENCRPAWQAVLMSNNEPLSKMGNYPPNAVSDAALRTVLANRREVALQRQATPASAPKRSTKAM